MRNKKQSSREATRPNLARHEFGCRICGHPQREEIERDFASWKSPARIATEYGIKNRASIYRHAHALDLFAERTRNVRSALEKIIEQVDEVEVSAAAVVQAVLASARISAEGRLVERRDQISVNDVFARMTPEELDRYAKNGDMPAWFGRVMGATSSKGHDGGEND